VVGGSEAEEIIAFDRVEGLLDAENGAAERVVAEAGLLSELEDEVVGLIGGFTDFLQDDALLAFNFFGGVIRREDKRQSSIQHFRRISAEAADEIGGALVFGGGVHRGAARFYRLGDFAGVAATGALESHVLEEMRQTVALGRLKASA